ncbi:hypothetical protein SQ11_03640 [Nitrosospira sp. NpAV]|nr:hypothetical protein SQ11_03640 [Nitrosospira sp. NpAV]
MNGNGFDWPGRLGGNPAHDLVIAYLTIDIQKNAQWAEELLQKTREVKSGQISSWERIGNAYWLRLFPDHVEIEEDYTEETGEAIKIAINDFEAAAAAWQEFVRQHT